MEYGQSTGSVASFLKMIRNHIIAIVNLLRPLLWSGFFLTCTFSTDYGLIRSRPYQVCEYANHYHCVHCEGIYYLTSAIDKQKPLMLNTREGRGLYRRIQLNCQGQSVASVLPLLCSGPSLALARTRNFFPTLVPGSGRFQLTNLLGYSSVLRFGLGLGFGLGL